MSESAQAKEKLSMTEEPLRSDEQNRRLWAMLTDLSRQLRWPVDGEMQWLTKYDWKVIMTAGLVRHQRLARGIEGGFVVLGTRTSTMPMRVMSDMITLMFAFGAEHNIQWTDPTVIPIEAYAVT